MINVGLRITDEMLRGASGTPPDTTPPGQVTDLTGYQDGNGGDVILEWHAAGDDGQAGTAAYYDIRLKLGVITDETSWAAATSEFGGWAANAAPGGAAQSYVPFWEPGNNYYALRYKDEAGNVGRISNCVMVSATA